MLSQWGDNVIRSDRKRLRDVRPHRRIEREEAVVVHVDARVRPPEEGEGAAGREVHCGGRWAK